MRTLRPWGVCDFAHSFLVNRIEFFDAFHEYVESVRRGIYVRFKSFKAIDADAGDADMAIRILFGPHIYIYIYIYIYS